MNNKEQLENNSQLGLYSEQSTQPYFHLRLFRYYYLYTTEIERRKQKDTDIIFFEFEDGRYSIKYLDLKIKADQDTSELIANNKIYHGQEINYKLNLPSVKKLK